MDNFTGKYVPELDGLRGIAILSVLIHHQLTPFTMKGGFLGVDLFFVLSGFLITSLLAAEFDRTKTISLKNFYMRRVLRLGPCLFVYLCGCVIVAAYTQSIGLAHQLKLIFYSLVYLTNWRMAFGWDSTLDSTAIIWSLSIEEQFYLVWPAIFTLCALLRIRRRYIALTLLTAIVLILLHRYQLFRTGTDLSRLYYGTDTRADALLIGCLAALIPVRIFNSLRIQPALWLTTIAAAIGLIYITFTVEFASSFLYSGGFTLVALLSACVVFVSANARFKALYIVLSFPLLRWVGRISYGLYLWHWLVVRNTSFYYVGKWEPWVRLGLAVGLAAASFYLIERPFNKLKRKFTPGIKTTGERSPRTAPKDVAPLALPVTN